MHAFETLRLETPRLLLRPPQAEDFAPLAAFLGDPIAAEHLGGAMPAPLAWRSLAALVGSWALQGFAMFSVIERASGTWVGRVGPWQPYAWPGTEVGWGIAREHWGKGYAPEAAGAAIDWAFAQLGWSEVIHTIAPDNANSKAVARKLGSGFLRMGRLPEPHHEREIEIWGQSRAQWLAAAEARAVASQNPRLR